MCAVDGDLVCETLLCVCLIELGYPKDVILCDWCE